MRTGAAWTLLVLAMAPDVRAQALKVVPFVASLPDATSPTVRSPQPRDRQSVVFDHASAASRREDADFSGVVIVEAVRPDAPRTPRGRLEARFAAALSPAVRPAVSLHIGAVMDVGAPCLSVAGADVPFGGRYNPHPVCP